MWASLQDRRGEFSYKYESAYCQNSQVAGTQAPFKILFNNCVGMFLNMSQKVAIRTYCVFLRARQKRFEYMRRAHVSPKLGLGSNPTKKSADFPLASLREEGTIIVRVHGNGTIVFCFDG